MGARSRWFSPKWVKVTDRHAEPVQVDLATTPVCPACGASLRPAAPWCTLCYADLRPPTFAPPPPPAPAAVVPEAVPSEAGAPSHEEPSWPCSVCGSANSFDLVSCSSCGAGFLSAIADSSGPTIVVPVVGDVMALSKAQRMGLAFGLIFVVLVLTLLVGLVFR